MINDMIQERFISAISKCMYGYQKDYYKECTLVDVLFSKPPNPILVIFGKTVEEIWDYERNDTYAYRTMLHYWHSSLIHYPKGSSRRDIEQLIIQRISKIFTKADD